MICMDRDNIAITRVSLALDEPLSRKLDEMVRSSGYGNRSEFVRDMIREQMVARAWEAGQTEVLGTITLIYNHHQRELCAKLTEIQHDAKVRILAATHVHLSHELCAEMIMTVGQPDAVRELHLALRRPRGILHAALSMSSAGGELQ